MSTITAGAEPSKIAGPGDNKNLYDFRLEGNALLLARSKRAAKDFNSPRRRLRKGDRGTLKREEGEELWAYNDDLTGDGSDAQLDLSQAGFFLDFGSRPVVGAVDNSAGDEAPAASDNFFEAGATGVDVNASTEQNAFTSPDAAEVVVVSVDEATGSFHVELHGLASSGGSVLTTRDDNDLSGYAGDSTSDVFMSTDIMAAFMRVDIVDDSGAANTVDYSIYAR